MTGVVLTILKPCHLHPLQAVNGCRNSRLVIDDVGLKWVANEKKDSVVIETVPLKLSLLNPRWWKLSHSSQMQNDALMHL